jgi:hypothetical protein
MERLGNDAAAQKARPVGVIAGMMVLAATHRSLNRPSIDAVQKWKFEPVDAVLTVETELDYKFDDLEAREALSELRLSCR